MISRFVTAWNFLTVIPFPFSRREDFSSENLGRSLVAFPLVGLLLGLFAGGAYFGLEKILPPMVVAISIIFGLTLMTRGLHLDGLADTIDGLQGKSREASLRIMRESTIGAFGALGLIFLVLFKFSSLYSLPFKEGMKALFVMPILGRWAFVTLLVFFPYARMEGGIASPFIRDARPIIWIGSTLFTVIGLFLIASWQGEILTALVLLLTLVSGSFFKSRLGGVTGDIVGGTGEVIEALSLIFWNVYMNLGFGG
jgi:adenosylcobinamide-GDP ribazoletransferase